ncbi:hypothetical protein PRIC1_001832 [Phytophthora ramorum]
MNCSENDYSHVHTYNPSKLCNVLFTMELSQLFEANGVNDVIAVACNPGVSATNLKAMMPAAAKTAKRNWFWKLLFNLGEFQPQQKKCSSGELWTLYAAQVANLKVSTTTRVKCFKPFGSPVREDRPELSKSKEVAIKWWALRERLARLASDVQNGGVSLADKPLATEGLARVHQRVRG